MSAPPSATGSSETARCGPTSTSWASPEAPPCTVTVAIVSSSSRAGSSAEDPVPAAVLARGLHEPLHAVGVGARRQLARGREHEARARAGSVDAAPHLGLDLGLGGALEDRDVHVADGHDVLLVAERDEAGGPIDVGLRVRTPGPPACPGTSARGCA